MAGFDSGRAIGAVSQLLKNHLTDRTSVYATVGHPETASDGSNTRYNLFLYEAAYDASMRSRSLDEQRPAPLWLTLRYLLTSYDGGNSDTIAAHRSLGDAMRVLQDLAYLPVTGLADDRDTAALTASPEPLKVTFVEAPSELLGRVLQGSDERYRFSIAFEVRPVMIALSPPGEDALLVGVQYATPPMGDLRPPGVDIVLDPGLQVPTLLRVAPVVVELGGPRSRMTLSGRGFAPGDLACIGPVELLIAESAGLLVADLVSPDHNGAAVPELISAGAHLLDVAREVTREGRVRRRTSNPLTVRILPILTTATVTDTERDDMTPDPDRAVVTIELVGVLLGTERDDVAVALWSAGVTAASTDDVVDVAATAPQTTRTATVRNVPGGSYRVIVRVNGAQATHSPIITVVVPP